MNAIPTRDCRLARAYVPPQAYTGRWCPMDGLHRGTIFPELYSPYVPSEFVVEGGYDCVP